MQLEETLNAIDSGEAVMSAEDCSCTPKEQCLPCYQRQEAMCLRNALEWLKERYREYERSMIAKIKKRKAEKN
jgi:hypothetical protein